MNDKELSKFLSLLLRHQPEKLGITLAPSGWADVPELLDKMNRKGLEVTLEQLQKVVATNNKQRFTLTQHNSKIRANQGHSFPVDVGLTPTIPPEFLYHGTATKNVEAILKEGIQKQTRLHVHLSAEIATATQVGGRHGKPFVFLVKSGRMHAEGIPFFLSENNVWLTNYVAPQYIEAYEAS